MELTDWAACRGAVSGALPSGASTKVSQAKAQAEVIEATPQHPFWVVGKGWLNASELLIGDKLLTREGSYATVRGTTVVEKSVQVYNFEVAELHTYFVGEQEQWLVHNSYCGKPLMEPGSVNASPYSSPQIKRTYGKNGNSAIIDHILGLPDSYFDPNFAKYPHLIQDNIRAFWSGRAGKAAAVASDLPMLKHTLGQYVGIKYSKNFAYYNGGRGIWEAVSYRYAKRVSDLNQRAVFYGDITHPSMTSLTRPHFGPPPGSIAMTTELPALTGASGIWFAYVK